MGRPRVVAMLLAASLLVPAAAPAAATGVYGPAIPLANPQGGVSDLSAQWTSSPADSFVVSWYAQGFPGNDGYLLGARGPFAAGVIPTTLLGPEPQATAFAGLDPAVGYRATGAVVVAAPIGTQPGARLGTTAGSIAAPLPAARPATVAGTVRSAVLGMRADGGAVIAAATCSTPSCGRRTVALVTRSDTGQVSRPVTITGGGVARPVVIAVNARGDAFVAWVRANRVEGRLRTAGGSVGPIASLGAAENSFAPIALTISAHRRVVVAWENQIVHEGSVVSSDSTFSVAVSMDGRAFARPQVLETQTDRVRTPGPAVVATQGSDGATWVGWTGRTAGRFVVHAARINSGGNGSGVQTPSTTTTADAAVSDISGGERHSLAIVWVETPIGELVQDSVVMASVQRSEYAPWSTPETVDAATGVFRDEQFPVVSIQPGTRTALFAWTRDDTGDAAQDEHPAVRTRTIP